MYTITEVFEGDQVQFEVRDVNKDNTSLGLFSTQEDAKNFVVEKVKEHFNLKLD